MNWEPIVAGGVGTVLGFGLTEITRRRAEHTENAGFRRMLALEIDQNLTAVRSLRAGIDEKTRRGGSSNVSTEPILPTDQARALVGLPPPSWSSDVYRSNLSILPRALHPPKLEPIFQHYQCVGSLIRGRDLLMDYAEQEEQAELSHDISTQDRAYFTPNSLIRHAKSVMANVEAEMTKMLDLGNPLSR